MITLSQLKEAHARVKSGADFPRYLQDLIVLGVSTYTTYVKDGHTEFTGNENEQVLWEAKYPDMDVATEGDPGRLQHYLGIHQQGQTDYPTFCKQAAETGVEKWTVDLRQMTCTYYDTNGSRMLAEDVPAL